MQKSYRATQTQNMESKYDWKETLTLEAETAEIWKKVELILERQGCQSVFGHAQQQQACVQSDPNQTYQLRYVETWPGVQPMENV